MKLSVPADSIKVIGAHHRTLAMACATDSVAYTLLPEDPYARLTAYFPQGEVIYSNPFARYDASVSDSPFTEPAHTVNILLTLLFNLLLLGLLSGVVYAFYKFVIKW